MRKTGKSLLKVIVFLSTQGLVASSIFLQPKNYNGSYIPSLPGGIALTSSSSTLGEQLASSSGVGSWGINFTAGSAGIVRTSAGVAGARDSLAGSMVVESNGSFAIIGNASTGFGATSQGFVIRFLANGTFDPTFNGTGSLLFNAPSDVGRTAVACIVSDGQGGYYVGGNINSSSSGFITHITNAGTIDVNFGSQGFSVPAGARSINGLGLQSNGTIVYVAATAAGAGNGFSVGRLTAQGTTDTTFTIYAAGTLYPAGLAIDSQQRIIVTGTDNVTVTSFWTYRISANGGTLDPAFNNGAGYSWAGQASALIILPDDSIIVVGRSGVIWGIFKFAVTGVPDPSFGSGTGTVAYRLVAVGSNLAIGVCQVPGGRLAVVGEAFDGVRNWYGTLLLNTDGSLNQYFYIPGQVAFSGVGSAQVQIPTNTTSFAHCVGYQSLGALSGIVVAGYSSTPNQPTGLIFYTSAGAPV